MSQDFKLVSSALDVERRSFEAADPSILDPSNANPLVLGEWLEITSAYTMGRGTGNGAMVPSFAVFSEKGRYDVQAIGKVPILYFREYEADTKIMLATSIAIGDALMVNDVTIGGLTKRGLVKAAGGGFVVGRATRLPASNSGYLRFIAFKT